MLNLSLSASLIIAYGQQFFFNILHEFNVFSYLEQHLPLLILSTLMSAVNSLNGFAFITCIVAGTWFCIKASVSTKPLPSGFNKQVWGTALSGSDNGCNGW